MTQIISSFEYRNWAFKNHHTKDDFDYGDLQDRIEEFDLYYLKEIDISELDQFEHYVDLDRAKEYSELQSTPEPVLVHFKQNKYTIVDGIHRLNSEFIKGKDKIFIYSNIA